MRRLFLSVSHLSWPVQAPLVCAVFLLVGSIIADDYSAGRDVLGQQKFAEKARAFVMGDADHLGEFSPKHNKYYGVVFELPLLLLVQGLELEDPRNIYLMRHLVTHLFFLAGGLCCSLLVYRLSNRRGVALVALLLFLLQPRLYAHSFFNSKDLPFLSMFMITLYLTHRAFRKETVGAFLLCGVSVGILTNLRIMGVMLYPAVLALRGLDMAQAGREKRKHVLVTGAVFALAGPGTLYVLSPYLWTDPLGFFTAVQVLAYHPTTPIELFQERLVWASNLPWNFIPTWIAISTPPVALVCGVLGATVVGLHSIREPRAALGNTDLRFGLLLVTCLTLPVVGIVVLGSHLYDNWRHVFFLHAPLCGLGGMGLRWARKRVGRVAYAPAGIGMAIIIGEMVSLHPSQQVYFNSLVDKITPEFLRTQYEMDPRGDLCLAGLEFLRRRYPNTIVSVHNVHNIWQTRRGWFMLPREDRSMLVLVRKDSDVRISCGKVLRVDKYEDAFENVIYAGKVYNNTIVTVTTRVTVPDRTRSLIYRTARY